MQILNLAAGWREWISAILSFMKGLDAAVVGLDTPGDNWPGWTGNGGPPPRLPSR
ncbi:MAG: hypothetical protein WBK48_06635 [Dethiobacteria bacterium]|nr:hypothetical protein [Bacillota bacterium]HPZ65073.1 hypothetical protein [Bacillota bacterium]